MKKKPASRAAASRKPAAKAVTKKPAKAKAAPARKSAAKAAPGKAAPAAKKPAAKKAAAASRTAPVKKAAAVKKAPAPKKAAARKPAVAAKRAAVAGKPVQKRPAAATRAAGLLPPAFADLESFVAMWALPGSDARFRQRLNSTAAERQAFYNALAPRGGDALAYLDSKPFDPDRMSDPDRNLLRLMLALAEVSLTEEVNGQTVEAIHAQSNRLMNFTREIDSL